MRIYGLEEHFVTEEVRRAWAALDPAWSDSLGRGGGAGGEIARRLLDFGEERVAAMDHDGIDVAVLSLTTPALQCLDRADAVALQGLTNDALAERVRERPDRYAGLAALATPDPDAAADELHRAVSELGLDGAMLYGRTREQHLDDPGLWPIYEAAEALGAPLVLHPQPPLRAVAQANYAGFSPELDAALATFGLGWHLEVGIELVRMILRGVFDRFPALQVITGHWGEGVLFFFDRIERMAAMAGCQRRLSEYARENLWVLPSGIFSPRYLRWAIEVVGVDRVMMAVDYPYVPIPDGGAPAFLAEGGCSPDAQAAIGGGNWERLRAGIRR
jgi:predicted TIM-barrel fold metal-dependent hydrolase